jgi:DNA-binding MarR family transcriptional regulator
LTYQTLTCTLRSVMSNGPKSNGNFYLESVKGRPSAEVFNAIACIFALIEQRSEKFFKPYHLTPVKFNTLLLLKHLGKDEGLSQNDLCRHLIVTPSNITRLLDRLIDDGYATREIHTKDRRINLIKITQKGSNILDQVFHGYGEMIQQTVYLLPRPEVEQLSALLLKWFGRLEKPQGENHESDKT